MSKRVFHDKVAIITGGASGIGRCLAQQLAALGARVTVADIDGEAAAALAEALVTKGGLATSVQVDVADREAVKALVNEVASREGSIDFLFNNAGIVMGGEARDYEPADWRRVLEVNLFGVIHGIDAAYPIMVKQGHGHIVNTASIAGLVPLPGEVSYVASKYAVVGLSHALRAEAAGLGVRVSCVCPGKIETPIYETSRVIGFEKEAVMKLLPRGISPEECAEVILRGVAKNRSTIVVTRLAKALWALARLHPDALILVGRSYIRRMREHRLVP